MFVNEDHPMKCTGQYQHQAQWSKIKGKGMPYIKQVKLQKSVISVQQMNGEPYVKIWLNYGTIFP